MDGFVDDIVDDLVDVVGVDDFGPPLSPIDCNVSVYSRDAIAVGVGCFVKDEDVDGLSSLLPL